jgi:hypothetical protein
MSQETPPPDITKMKVVYDVPGTGAVTVRADVEFRAADGGALAMDLYYPPASKSGSRLPVVVVVVGYSDVGVQKMLGCRFKEMASAVSWGRLIAASGMVAITYTNREPQGDLRALTAHVRENAASLGIDEKRIGIWSSSGNVPMALSMLMQSDAKDMRCAVLCYGYMLDLGGATGVADAAAQFRFVNAAAGKSVDDLPAKLPLFLARAGQDQFAHLNESLDAFVAGALTRNLPVTVVNHADGPHAFDLLHDSEATREIIRQMLRFMQFHLQA